MVERKKRQEPLSQDAWWKPFEQEVFLALAPWPF